MAVRVEHVSEWEAASGLKCVYVNTTPVGNDSDNKRMADVQLVQLFLRYFFYRNQLLFKKLPKPPRGASPEVLITGKINPQTVAAIIVFRPWVKDRGKSVVFVDNRVSVPSALRILDSTHV